MRTTVSLVPALLVTLGLLYLMQYMVNGQSRRMSRFEEYATVDFVRLHRATEPPSALGPRRRPAPKPLAAVTPLVAPEWVSVEPAAPAAPALSADLRRFEHPALSTKPYLGSLPVEAPRPVPAAKPRLPARRSAKPAPGRYAAEHTPDQTALASLPKAPTGGRPGAKGGSRVEVPGGDGAGDDHLVPLFRMAPRYPRKAAMSGQEGWVKVAFTITEKGTVADAVVVESKPRRVFNRSALTAIRKWRFKPQVIEGKPVPVRATQVIEFKLASK